MTVVEGLVVADDVALVVPVELAVDVAVDVAVVSRSSEIIFFFKLMARMLSASTKPSRS